MSKLQVSIVQQADYPRLAAYLASYPGERRGAEVWQSRFHHWWEANPAFQPALPRGWMLEGNGEIKGFLGSLPSRMYGNGEEFTGFGMTTWRVSPEARSQSLDLLYPMAIAGEPTLTLNTTANEDVRNVMRGLRFEERESNVGGMSSVLPARGGPLSTAASLFLNLPFQFSSSKIEGETRELGPGTPELDSTLDRFWQSSRGRAPLSTVRDARFFRWFCFQDPLLPKFLLGHFVEGKLRATGIFCRRAWPRKTELEFVDFWTDAVDPKEETKLACALIGAAKTLGDRERCDLVRYPHFTPAFSRALREKKVWISRPDGRRHFFHGKFADSASGGWSGVEGDFAL